MKERGSVKWFSAPKGYGFIKRSTGEDVFVHYTSIEMDGYRKLREGDEVEYELKEGPRGLLAAEVVPVGRRTGQKEEATPGRPSPDKPGEPAGEADTGAAGGAADDLASEAEQDNGGVLPENSPDNEDDGTSSGSAKGQSVGG